MRSGGTEISNGPVIRGGEHGLFVEQTIPLGGKPEAGVSDAEASRVYVNIEDKNEIAVIDTDRYAVVARWPIAPGADASGLAIDLSNHRLFVGAHNSLMLMVDSSTGAVLARVPIGRGVDATWFDPGTGYVFSSCSDGTTTVAHEDSPEKLTVVQTLQTERGARTMALDPAAPDLSGRREVRASARGCAGEHAADRRSRLDADPGVRAR